MMATDPFEIEAFTLLSLSIAIILFRTFARHKQVGFKNFEADDYLMILVIVPYTTETILAYYVGAAAHGLTNSGLTDQERASLDPSTEEFQWRVTGSKIQVAGWLMYVTVLWMIKAALCAFYSGLAGYKVRMMVGFGLIAATYVAVVASILFACRPFHAMWQIYPDPGNVCQPALSKVNLFVTVSLNIVTDLYLILIPIPMLWAAQLPRIKKIGLIFLFSGGIFVMVAGLLRCVLILKNPITGPRQGSSWAVRESFVAVATSSLPMIWSVVRRWLKPFLGSLLSSNKQTPYADPANIILAERGQASKSHSQPTRSSDARKDSADSGKDFPDFNDGGSEEIMVHPQSADVGGIRKDVEFTVTTTKAEGGPGSPESTSYFDTR